MYLIYAILTIFFIFLVFYISKKFRKYNSIFQNNGLDGVYYYFINKNFYKTGLSNFIEKKKNILGNKLAKAFCFLFRVSSPPQTMLHSS